MALHILPECLFKSLLTSAKNGRGIKKIIFETNKMS